MLISPLASKVARNLHQGITATEIALDTGIPLEKVQIALDELQSKAILTVDEYGLVNYSDPTLVHYSDPTIADDGSA
jgi:DNA-directed RNA polymerase specialized sigma subunit